MTDLLDTLRGKGAPGPARRLALTWLVACFLVSGLSGFKPGQAHAAMHMDEAGDVHAHHAHAHHAQHAAHAGEPTDDPQHAPDQCQLERHCAATCAQGGSLLPAARSGPLPADLGAGLLVTDELPPAEPAADRLLRPPRILLTA